jgi:hypothetical protein
VKGFVALIRREPAIVAGVISAIIAVIAAFGLDVSAEATAAILGLAAVIVAIIVRSQVVPAAAVPARVADAVLDPAVRATVTDHVLAKPSTPPLEL